MPFVSYAQNFEDLMLWRALGNIENGFYIDIGALSPQTDTVTRAFYENGWRGINVEPNPKYLSELNEYRPEDINLGIVISDHHSRTMFHVFENPGLSTLDPIVAEAHLDSGMASKIMEVDARTISEIWKEYVQPDQDVHFLKVDVEGHEAAVVRGGNWKDCRPWIIVIEATYPNSQRAMHDEWEGSIVDSGYEMVYWDGLNRFYLAHEHLDLKPAFSAPPNVFDDYALARYEAPITQLKAELKEAIKGRDAAMTARNSAEAAYHEIRRIYDDAVNAYHAQRAHSEGLEQALAAEIEAKTEALTTLRILRENSIDLEQTLAREVSARSDTANDLAVAQENATKLERALASEMSARKDAEKALSNQREKAAELERALAAANEDRMRVESRFVEMRNLSLLDIARSRVRERFKR